MPPFLMEGDIRAPEVSEVTVPSRRPSVTAPCWRKHHRGELFPRVGFIVTNMVLPSRSVVRFYNKRGTAEQWIKEGKQATHWTRLSCHRFRANEVRLLLSVLADGPNSSM